MLPCNEGGDQTALNPRVVVDLHLGCKVAATQCGGVVVARSIRLLGVAVFTGSQGTDPGTAGGSSRAATSV